MLKWKVNSRANFSPLFIELSQTSEFAAFAIAIQPPAFSLQCEARRRLDVISGSNLSIRHRLVAFGLHLPTRRSRNQIRNSKSEIRNKSKIQMQKIQNRRHAGVLVI